MRQALRLAEFVLITGIPPSEAQRMTKLQQMACIEVANATARQARHK